jgi:hypothetical protein
MSYQLRAHTELTDHAQSRRAAESQGYIFDKVICTGEGDIDYIWVNIPRLRVVAGIEPGLAEQLFLGDLESEMDRSYAEMQAAGEQVLPNPVRASERGWMRLDLKFAPGPGGGYFVTLPVWSETIQSWYYCDTWLH